MNTIKNEIWKDIEGYEGVYRVSNMGRVYSVKRNIMLKPQRVCDGAKDGGGYRAVRLCVDGEYKMAYIHRLVAQAFLPNPQNLPQVNHKDEDKTNNRVENLEWCDDKYNKNYGTIVVRRTRTTKKTYSERHENVRQEQARLRKTYNAKESKWKHHEVLQFDLDGNFIACWKSVWEIHKVLGIDVNSCVKGKVLVKGNSKWLYREAQ